MGTYSDARQRVMSTVCVGAMTIVALVLSTAAHAQETGAMEDDQVSLSFVQTLKPKLDSASNAAGGGGVLGRRSNGGVLGVDSLANFSSYFYRHGQDGNGYDQYTWPYTMVGNPPFGKAEGDRRDDRDRRDRDDEREGTTIIGAPIIPVNLDLRNADGTPRFVNGVRLFSDATKYVAPVLKSPIFSPASFDSSRRPTQYSDAIHRAQFYSEIGEGWHTLLKPVVRSARTMVLKQGSYRFALNADGSCCAYVLVDDNVFINALFPATSDNTDTASVIGAAERAGDIKTTDLSTFLFPGAFLYSSGNPANCCVLGFHSYDLQAGDYRNGFRERRYVMNYSSWLPPGIFSGFEDVAVLSHEIAETFADPFVNNFTPWWLDPTAQICQNDLEDADVLEALDDPTYPMLLNGFTYHPQTVALLQWFAGQKPSSAYHGAYSFPGLNVLTSPSVSFKAGCTAPLK